MTRTSDNLGAGPMPHFAGWNAQIADKLRQAATLPRSLRSRTEILIRKSGDRRRLDYNHRSIVTLVARVARRGQLSVGRSKPVAVLSLDGLVERRQRFLDRRR